MTPNTLKRETEFDIPARDGKDIFCRVNYAADTHSDKAVILAHGLTGHVNEYIHMAARDYFNARGYDVYRISFYCDGDNHRHLQNTTLQIHANDMNDLVEYLKDKYQKIYVCGHSYGGATILFANPDVTTNAFWDSTIYPWEGHWKDQSIDLISINDNEFIQSWTGIPMVFGHIMLEEAKTSTPRIMKAKSQDITAPSLVAIAEHGDFEKNKRKELFDNLTCQKNYVLINGADHCFTNGHTVQDLLNKTHQWFERF